MNGQQAVGEIPAELTAADISGKLGALFDSHSDRLYRLARRLTPTSDDARDLVQDTYLRAAGSVGSIPAGNVNEEAWLVRVLVNIRRDQWRRAAVRKRVHTDIRDSAPPPSPNSNLEASFIAHTTVWHALDALQPRRRAVIIMYELEGLTIPAIATSLGISAITVRWHLSRGRRDLSNAIEALQRR